MIKRELYKITLKENQSDPKTQVFVAAKSIEDAIFMFVYCSPETLQIINIETILSPCYISEEL